MSQRGQDLFNKQRFRDFANTCQRKLIKQNQPFRKLEFCNPLLRQELANLLQRWRLARLWDHTSTHSLSQHWIRYRHTGNIEDRRVSQDQFLNLLGTDLLPTTVNQVFLPTLDDIIARGVTSQQIARFIISISSKTAFVIFSGPKIAAQRVRTTYK